MDGKSTGTESPDLGLLVSLKALCGEVRRAPTELRSRVGVRSRSCPFSVQQHVPLITFMQPVSPEHPSQYACDGEGNIFNSVANFYQHVLLVMQVGPEFQNCFPFLMWVQFWSLVFVPTANDLSTQILLL